MSCFPLKVLRLCTALLSHFGFPRLPTTNPAPVLPGLATVMYLYRNLYRTSSRMIRLAYCKLERIMRYESRYTTHRIRFQ